MCNNFKSPKQYPQIEVSTRGDVRYVHDKQPCRMSKDGNGYYRCAFKHNGRRKVESTHRLVLYAHNPIDGCQNLHVNHINGIKTDNRLINLEWCTPRENNLHAITAGLTRRPRWIDVIDVRDGKTYKFTTTLEVAEFFSISASRIQYSLKQPNWRIISPGIRVKTPDNEWLPVPKKAEMIIRGERTNTPVDLRNVLTGEELFPFSQTEAASLIGSCDAVISSLLNTSNQRCLPNGWQVKYIWDDWEYVSDPIDKIKQDNPSIKPIRVTYPNGETKVFLSITSCCGELKLGKTNICYNLKHKHGIPNRHGFVFEYY